MKRAMAEYFEAAVAAWCDAKRSGQNWVHGAKHRRPISMPQDDRSPNAPQSLRSLRGIGAADRRRTISGKDPPKIFLAGAAGAGLVPPQAIRGRPRSGMSSDPAITADRGGAAWRPNPAEDGGRPRRLKNKLQGFSCGQLIERTGGRADPQASPTGFWRKKLRVSAQPAGTTTANPASRLGHRFDDLGGVEISPLVDGAVVSMVRLKPRHVGWSKRGQRVEAEAALPALVDVGAGHKLFHLLEGVRAVASFSSTELFRAESCANRTGTLWRPDASKPVAGTAVVVQQLGVNVMLWHCR